MKSLEKKRILKLVVLVGVVAIMLVVLSAYAAELRVENNNLMSENKVLQGEIDTINVKIKTANNIEYIERVATNKLGMVYPDESECVYVTGSDTPKGNLATVIRAQAYN